MVTFARCACACSFLTVVFTLGGCGSQNPNPAATVTTSTSRPAADRDPNRIPDDAELKKALDDALDFTLEMRRLDVKDQAAWQIIHGALAYKRKFLVRAGDKDVPAVE